MKQLTQSIKTGETSFADVPVPSPGPGQVLIRSSCSLVSLGTERMLVEFGNANLLQKAIMQPKRVLDVLQKARADGITSTVQAVSRKLDQTMPLGYSSTGTVVSVGESVTSISVGDRVVSNGPHAEFVCVAENLCARIPDEIDDETASFTVLGAIGLQGIRLLNPTYGESVVVFGLGLIGLIATQILKANGCEVIGIDTDPAKCRLAESLGIQTVVAGLETDPVNHVQGLTTGGADAVLITASTSSNVVIEQSAQMLRKRGRIVLVGVIGLDINRADFYEKEITFQVSCSYGPGRYDPDYEEKGRDYPVGFVRWTEKRNFEAVLNALKQGHIQVGPLITQRFSFEDCLALYSNIGDHSQIASLLSYSGADPSAQIANPVFSGRTVPTSRVAIGLVGAGNFASNTLAPIIRELGIPVSGVCSSGGLSASQLSPKVDARFTCSSVEDLLLDSETNLLVITTRHGDHSDLVVQGLEADKHIFVEKPLCLNRAELDAISASLQAAGTATLTVGFNRRFAPLALEMKQLVDGPANIVITINAGFIPKESWVQDMETGGGRIVGEACHFMDLAVALTGEKIISVVANNLGAPDTSSDNMSLLLRLEGGSQVSINYFANGHRSYSKEKVDVFFGGKVLSMDNWRSLRGWGFKNRISARSRQDKGHKNQLRELVSNLESSGLSTIPVDQIFNVSEAAIASLESIQEKSWIDLTNR